ncbi:MAG TPA: hypothetical protein VFV28_07525, partial [Limnobacter sp.]|nr:hypothetical protein [Limnobacter sp.]
MAERPRVALWFAEGLDNALAARGALEGLQAQHPDADWVLLGPKSSLCLFEMDNRVAAYIPLLSLGPRRPSQGWLSRFFETRTQYRQLRGVGFSQCMGVAVAEQATVQAGGPFSRQASQKHFNQLKSALRVPGAFIEKSLHEFLQADRPLLQAGPQALAFATQLHRTSPPHLQKLLVLLSDPAGRTDALLQQWGTAQHLLQQNAPAHITVAVMHSSGDRLLSRWLGKNQPNWLGVDLA